MKEVSSRRVLELTRVLAIEISARAFHESRERNTKQKAPAASCLPLKRGRLNPGVSSLRADSIEYFTSDLVLSRP